jgi:hypothetical protein
LLETLRLQEAMLDVVRDDAVELVHWDGAAEAASLTLAGLGRACVVPVASSLPGPQRHRLAAGSAEADASEQRWATDDPRRCQRRAARLEQHLHGLELGRVDDRRHHHFHDLAVGLALARLPELGVEAMAADVGRAREHLVHGAEAPASAVAGADACAVEMLGDRLHAYRPRAAVALARQAEDQPHGLGLDGIDLQNLLRAVAVLLGGLHDAVADRRQRAVPEALPRVLLHGPQRMLGVLLGLVFVEQRHDLADHVAHGIVAELLGDRDQAHAVLVDGRGQAHIPASHALNGQLLRLQWLMARPQPP